MVDLQIERRDASSGRVPAPDRGHVIVFSRYGADRAVVLNPDDFQRLTELDSLLGLPAVAPISDLALAAHLAEDTPDLPVEDPAEVMRLLGL